jgi:hypothetical protein
MPCLLGAFQELLSEQEPAIIRVEKVVRAVQEAGAGE